MQLFKTREGYEVVAVDFEDAQVKAQALHDQVVAYRRRPVWELQNMALALSLHSWSNSADDWRRMEAAVIALGRKAPRRARTVIKSYREYLQTEQLAKAEG